MVSSLLRHTPIYFQTVPYKNFDSCAQLAMKFYCHWGDLAPRNPHCPPTDAIFD